MLHLAAAIETLRLQVHVSVYQPEEIPACEEFLLAITNHSVMATQVGVKLANAATKLRVAAT